MYVLYFSGRLPLTLVIWWCKTKIKRSKVKVKVKVNGNKNVKKIVFHAYLHQKWIDLRQTKTKMINRPFYTYRWIHFTSGNVSFCDICL